MNPGSSQGLRHAAFAWLSRLLIPVAVVVAIGWATTPVLTDSPLFEDGTVLVRWGPGVRAQDDTLRAVGAQAVDSIPALGVTKLKVAPGKEQQTIEALKRAGAEVAEPNYLRHIALTPNDPLYASQWALTRVGAPAAWDITTGSSSIIVAVVDTGIDTSHPDRPQNLVLGADLIADSSGNTLVSGDPEGHGTHVSGIVAARMNNSAGVSGVAPGVSLMSVRVLDQYGSGDTETTASGIIYAADHGARVINLSLSGYGSSKFEQDAINYAYGKGALVVAAAGNCYMGGPYCDNQTNPVMYPAALANVLAVAATDSSDNHAAYSETGSYVDIAAPGGNGYSSLSGGILSTCIPSDNTYCVKSGTSMASPYVAGVAGLIWSVNPNLTPDQVESIMRQSATDLGTSGRDDTFGYGRIDAYQAVQVTQSTLVYSAQFVAQSFPRYMAVGQPVTAWVDVKNTGGATWYQSGLNPVRLGTSQPLDRTSPFYTAGNWINGSRPAALSQTSLAPGQVGRFTFVLTPPASGGTFNESYQVMVEGKTWLSQPAINFTVSVSLSNLPRKTYVPVLYKQASSGW